MQQLHYVCVNFVLVVSLVPQPLVEVSLNYSGILYAGTGLTLTCTVTLDPNVDNGENITVTWSSPRNISGERYFITEVHGSGETHTSSLTVSPLAEGEDDGKYTCNVTVSGERNVLESTSSDDITINVMGNSFGLQYLH